MPLIFFFHTTTHVSLKRKRSACRFLLKQQKLLLQLDWLLPYLLLLQLLLNKQLLPSHALLLKLHLEPCWRLRWSHTPWHVRSELMAVAPYEMVARKVAGDLCETGASEDSGLVGFGPRSVLCSLQSFSYEVLYSNNQSQFNYLRKRWFWLMFEPIGINHSLQRNEWTAEEAAASKPQPHNNRPRVWET